MRNAGALRTCVTAVFVVVASTASAWYPYSESYTKWQKARPMMMAALHNSVPTDQMTDRMARFKTAGLNTLV